MKYDIRDHLTPKRATIAMWDYSWLNAHYPGASFADFDRITDELLARGFNTVRIEAFPWIIGRQRSPQEIVTIPGNPLGTWGMSDRDRPHAVAQELTEFMEITRRKGIYVILSTWGCDCPEYPGKTPEEFLPVWEKTLAFLHERGLLGHVIYIDLDQEFPNFSSHKAKLNELGAAPAAANSAMAAMSAAGQRQPQRGLSWNDEQLDFVSNLFNRSIAHFQRLYPAQRFTFSLTGFWNECRLLNLRCFDVLELHCWVNGPRFYNRTGFSDMTKDRGQHDYADYQRRIDAAFSSVRPMLLHEMHQRLATAAGWASELSAPLTTSEAWGPWWHMDHPSLRWDWLRDWCAECNCLAGQYGFWGSTPWNYSHPYWHNWKDIAWYCEVNHAFLQSSRSGVYRECL
jgi:hypothetical protein